MSEPGNMKYTPIIPTDKIPRLLDIHCHVDLFEDPQEILQQAENQDIGVVAVTNTPSVFEHTVKLAAGTRYAQPALGLHPQLAEERAAELSLMWQLFDQTRFIGEIGLDYTDSRLDMRRRQKRVFSSILERCEASGDKILIVHSRRAAADVVSAIGGNFRGTVVLHWYSGPNNVLERAIQNGLYFSVNPAMVQSKRGNEIIRMLPPDRVLTETDAPFVSVGREPAKPLDVIKVITRLAIAWGESGERTRSLVMDNYRRCLNMTGDVEIIL